MVLISSPKFLKALDQALVVFSNPKSWFFLTVCWYVIITAVKAIIVNWTAISGVNVLASKALNSAQAIFKPITEKETFPIAVAKLPIVVIKLPIEIIRLRMILDPKTPIKPIRDSIMGINPPILSIASAAEIPKSKKNLMTSSSIAFCHRFSIDAFNVFAFPSMESM